MWMDWLEWIVKHWVTWAMGLLTAGITYLWRQAQRSKNTQKAIQDGVKALLRDRILQMYSICKSKGYCSIQDREGLESLYNAYHDGLHGNGTISDIYAAMRAMPREKERKDET